MPPKLYYLVAFFIQPDLELTRRKRVSVRTLNYSHAVVRTSYPGILLKTFFYHANNRKTNQDSGSDQRQTS